MFDYHIHTKFCGHAKGEMEEFVRSALNKNLDEIGFSCHVPREFYPEEVPRESYAMSMEDLENLYFPEIVRLQEKYKEQITIKTALEIDYFEWIQGPINSFIDKYAKKLDYIIGSVHVLNTHDLIWSVDDLSFKENYTKFGIDAVYNQYLDSILQMIQTGKYHIVAHLDLPKKYGFRPNNKKKYYMKIGEILDAAKKNDMSVEVSTGGLRKFIGEMYPEEDIINMVIDRGIPLVTSSDSHKPEEVAFGFSELYPYLKDLGVSHLANYDKGMKKFVSIE